MKPFNFGKDKNLEWLVGQLLGSERKMRSYLLSPVTIPQVTAGWTRPRFPSFACEMAAKTRVKFITFCTLDEFQVIDAPC